MLPMGQVGLMIFLGCFEPVEAGFWVLFELVSHDLLDFLEAFRGACFEAEG